MTDPATTADIMKIAKADMYAGRFEQTLNKLEAVIVDDPQNQDALYMCAVASRYLLQFEKASGYLTRLLDASPEFGRAHQEAGHLAIALGDTEQARRSLQRATRYNPGLEASWRKLAELENAAGASRQAQAALAQAERLKALPKELVAVTNLVSEGKLLKAEDLCRRFLKVNPKHVEGMRLLADIAIKLGVNEDAEILLENAVSFAPDNVQLRLDYIQTLRKRQKFAAALKEAEHLHKLDPTSPIFSSCLAIERMQTGDFDGALTLLDQVLAKLPDDPATLTSRGHALKTWGRHDDAIASYRKACETRPEQGDAWYALANLKTYRFNQDEIARMIELEADPQIGHNDRFHFCFALGKALEDAGEIATSFAYYDKGNALKRAQSRYTADGMEAEFAAQKEACTPQLFAEKAGMGHDAPDPIFILGLPRAGSTLIEQILASHSQVDGTLELPDILSLSQRLRGRQRAEGGGAYPANLGDLSAAQLAQLGRDYIESTRIHRAGATFFTDKMPNNFRHIGLIKLILPNAKIIDARRNPMDCCFSGFKQLFAEGQEFTYGLEEIGRYYVAYVDLMDHWERVLPGEILRVQHEDILDDLEGQVRRLLNFCQLPFEDSCLDFHSTRRSVRTASSEQVREPINRKGLDAWRKYEDYLRPLKATLAGHF